MTMVGEVQLDEVQAMYRSVIRYAVRDMALASRKDELDVKAWLRNREQFSTVCQLANWNEEWVRDMFTGINRIEGDIRKPVVKECLDVFKVVIRLTANTRRDSVPAVLSGEAQYTIADQGRVEYVDTPIRTRSRRRKGEDDSD